MHCLATLLLLPKVPVLELWGFSHPAQYSQLTWQQEDFLTVAERLGMGVEEVTKGLRRAVANAYYHQVNCGMQQTGLVGLRRKGRGGGQDK